MPRKIRQLKQDLRRAGYRQLPGRGKGDHTVWGHPAVPDENVVLDGRDGQDAQHYQERQVRDAIRAAREAQQEQEDDAR